MHNRFHAPFALFMGPQRSGTSWLHRYFLGREDVCLPAEVKELFFFDFNFDQGDNFYYSYFKEKPSHKLVMEVSATYFIHPDAPKRIYEYFGSDVKLICPLRHPVSRSYSLYNHFLRYGITTGSLQDACLKHPEILLSSHYASHLKNWGEYYDLKKIYICFQEDLNKNQEKFVKNLCDYLQIAYQDIPEEARDYYNVTTTPPVQFIATIAHLGAKKLRDMRLYWVINAAKYIGLKKTIFGPEQANSNSELIPEDDKAFLEAHLLSQIIELEELLGYSIDQWK